MGKLLPAQITWCRDTVSGSSIHFIHRRSMLQQATNADHALQKKDHLVIKDRLHANQFLTVPSPSDTDNQELLTKKNLSLVIRSITHMYANCQLGLLPELSCHTLQCKIHSQMKRSQGGQINNFSLLLVN